MILIKDLNDLGFSMNILFDTTFLVQLDRKNIDAIEVGKELFRKDFHLFISIISVTELMTGAKLSLDKDHATKNVFSILNLFNWVDIDQRIALKASDLSAQLIINKKHIDFQDVLIAATAVEIGVEYVVTENKRHFMQIEQLREKIYSIEDLKKKLTQ